MRVALEGLQRLAARVEALETEVLRGLSEPELAEQALAGRLAAGLLGHRATAPQAAAKEATVALSRSWSV